MSTDQNSQEGPSHAELGSFGLQPGSYTAQKLQHATPEHLYATTRRCFIGPIPEGWLKSNRKSWYKHHLPLANYSSRAATFSASHKVSHRRQITGLDGPSASAMYGHSFPRPDDLDGALDEDPEADGSETNAGDEETSAVDIPRSTAEEGEPAKALDRSSSRSPARSPSKPKDIQKTEETTLGGVSQGEESRVLGRTGESSSFATAPEFPQSSPEWRDTSPSKFGKSAQDGDDKSAVPQTTSVASGGSQPTRASIGRSSVSKGSLVNVEMLTPEGATESMVSLLPHGSQHRKNETDAKAPRSKFTAPIVRQPSLQTQVPEEMVDEGNMELNHQQQRDRLPSGFVRFDIPEEVADSGALLKTKLEHMTQRRSLRSFKQRKSRPGEVVKLEKMLIKVDSTMQTLPDDYDENDSLKTESRTVEKWREYMVVCRKGTNGDGAFSLQMYKSRVIPVVEQKHVQKRSTHEIPLIRKTTKVNLYSSLDKTVVVWLPWKKGTMIYIMRPRSAASSVEWYTFIRNALGSSKISSLQVNVPDLDISLWLENPFMRLEASREAVQAANTDDAAIIKTMQEEQAVAGNIIEQCMKMLEGCPEWANVLESWLKNEKMGLAWKRYDRLEWVYGVNEQKMYGTLAMRKTHDLELRPKEHYPTTVRTKSAEVLDEPAPIEGFLIRLTSQRGRNQRFGKMYFKRLYFFTHNQFFCFCRPAKALPPPPPKLPMTEGSKVPSASQIVDKIPLIYAINPYPTENGQLAWLKDGSSKSREKHDQDACDESQRKINTLLQSDGYINLCNVIKIRAGARGSTPADQNIHEGPEVDFHEDVEDSQQDDGATDQFDEQRTFELVLENKLVIRLQAYNKATRKEWMSRLERLVHYWKLRTAADTNLLKMIRHTNLERLQIDEEMESFAGQYAKKWEVTRADASPQLHHMCGISCCRTITLSGTLYRKPRRHGTFMRCGVILCNGHLLIFQGSLRRQTGEELPYTYNERQNAINLKDCYVYSGLVTEGDLLYQNQTFDSNHPGHHALPRIYLEDGWTSSDEDTTTCFVVWHSLRKSLFKSRNEEGEGKTRQRLLRVSRLGVTGRAVVFRTRSRAERDHWVMSINTEIERLQQEGEIRLVDER